MLVKKNYERTKNFTNISKKKSKGMHKFQQLNNLFDQSENTRRCNYYDLKDFRKTKIKQQDLLTPSPPPPPLMKEGVWRKGFELYQSMWETNYKRKLSKQIMTRWKRENTRSTKPTEKKLLIFWGSADNAITRNTLKKIRKALELSGKAFMIFSILRFQVLVRLLVML